MTEKRDSFIKENDKSVNADKSAISRLQTLTNSCENQSFSVMRRKSI